jgi:hypothetical protein
MIMLKDGELPSNGQSSTEQHTRLRTSIVMDAYRMAQESIGIAAHVKSGTAG